MIPIYCSLDEIPSGLGPSIAAIGNFDGMHLGHREILSAVAAEARELTQRGHSMRSIAITFDPHPEQFLRPVKAPKLLTPMAERIELLRSTGIDAVVALNFDAALAALPAEDFVKRILVDGLDVRGLHEGESFKFGRHAKAGVDELRKFGSSFGFDVHVHAPVRVRGMEVSSSAIRASLAAGDVRRARWMLGRPFQVRATQARGRGIGSRLLVPTINLAAYDGMLPGLGVYVTRLTVCGSLGERSFQAVTNVGNRPTFGEESFAVESHILDFEPIELEENTPIELEFLHRLRSERKWPSPEALKAQILKDVARAKRYFRLARGD